MIKQTFTVIPTEDPNIDVIDIQTDNKQFQTVNELLEYIRQDEINCAIEIAKRRYLRNQKQPDNIMCRLFRKKVVACI